MEYWMDFLTLLVAVEFLTKFYSGMGPNFTLSYPCPPVLIEVEFSNNKKQSLS